ncbi:MAG: fused MFS/spermidine synthase, partial [Deltaproteobacteria bacterium]|nr:fused MFS/spermidine synthase [Deltaproteobacteria bacterium]
LILLRDGTSLIVDYREIFWVFSAATIPVSLYIKKILDREIYAEALPELSAKDSPPTRKSGIPSAIIRRKDSPPTGEKPQALPVIVVPVVIMFFISGISGLVYEVIFAKSLSLVFGSTAVATTSVLVTYMGGMAAGYWLGGGAASKTRNPLRLYALCEAGIAVWCALSPVMLDGIRTVYVALALNSAPDNQALTALQVALGSLVFAPPAILMGYTLPVLARFVLDSGGRLGGAVGILYGVNTIGAASGALFSGYFLIPWFGIMSATFITAGLNLAVGLSAYLMSGSRSGILSATSSAKDSSAKDSPPTVTSSAKDSSAKDSPPTIIIFIILFIGGIVTFALETTYIHLLAVVAGNSAYAFSLMLFAFLAGLGIGAAAAKKFLLGGANPFGRIAYVEFSLAAVLLAGVFLWNDLPDYFASFELYPLARSFASREFIRFLVCCLAMMPPAICIGAIYPVAMEVIENAAGGRRLAKMGQAVSLNTAGNIIGAFLGGFIMLKHLGSLKTLHLIALTAVLLGFISIICANGGTRKRFAAAAGAVCLALFAFQPAGFDLDRLATGSNVYFASNNFGTVIDHAESVDGGLTTINKVENEGAEILTMLTNGKFQGDNGLNKEMTAQISFALYPAIHTPLRERALVIGLGTGVSVRVLHDAGFKNIEAAELSGDILKMARKYFGSVNRGVLDKPEVSVYVTDGRNFLLLNEKTYDVISMEVSSIWFAGAASLYNREFYRLAKARLNRNGAFQQWIQLHRISTIDVLSIIATMRSEFPYVWLYFAGKQGILIGCVEKCLPDEKTVGSLYSREEMKEVLSIAAPAPADLFEAILLTPEGVDSLLSKAYSIGVDPDHIISTDDNLFLEFSTPKGNVRSYNASLQENVAFLKQFSPVSRGKDSAPTE